MKKFTLLMVMLFISLTCIMAQAVSEYTFATATNGSLEDMSTGTTTLLSGYSDSGATAVTDIGFTFTFSGTAYTQFSANANGLVRLGGTAISGYSTSPVASAAILGSFSGDDAIASTGKIHYKLIGSEAPRKLVIEFKDIRLPYGSSPGTGTLSTIQVWLNETSNVVDFVYGTMYNNSTSSISRGVFISTTNTTGNVGSVATITTTPSWVTTGTSAVTSSFTASSNMTNLHSAADGSRRVFSFSPPDPLAVPSPANVSSPGNAATGILRTATLNWASGGGLPTGYRLSFGTDNPPTNIVNNMDMGLVTTYDPNPDMAYGTTYYWKVVAYNGNGDAVGSPVWSFTTAPDPTVTVFPYTEGFESGNTHGSTSVSNWTQAYVTGTKYWTINSTNTDYNRTPRTGSFNTTLAYSASTWLFRPVQLIGGTSYDFEVWARQDNANSTYASMTLAYGDQATPAAMVNTIVTQTPLTNGDYQRLLGSFTPPTSGIYYLGILGTLPTSTNWYVSLDDITIRETPSVPIISVVPESWDFGTQLINTINPKEFTITNDGGAPLILSSVNVTGTGFALSGTFSQITLQPLESTTITVNFSPISEGVHNGSIAINDNRAVTNIPLTGTAIDVTIYAEDLPFLENFDNVTTPALPIGWSKRVTDTSTYGYVQTTTTGYSTPNRVVLYNSSDSASDLILITPPVDVELNTLRVKFMAYGGANYTLQVGTANSAGQDATFTPYQTVNPTASWNQFSVDFSAYAGTDQYIAFRHGQGGTYRSIYVDDVTIEEPQAIAPEVATLVYPADGLTTLLNPMLKWAASPTGEPAHGFKVYLNDTGTFTEGDLVYTGTATSFQTTLASYESSYFWKVVPYNAIGDATGASTWSFSTPTERQLAEGFELTAFPPAGWANGTSGSFTRSTTTPYEGLASAYKYTSTTVTYVLSTPMLTIVDGSMLEFYAHTTTANAYQTIQIATSPDRVTWTPLGTPIVLASAGPWQYYTVDLSSVPGNLYVGFQTPSVTSTGGIYIDHVIGPDVTPLRPGAVTLSTPADLATNVNEYSTFTWTAPTTGGVPTGYKLYVDTVNPPVAQVADLNALTYTLNTPLAYNTTYYWSVAAYNGAGTGPQAAVRSFTTRANPTITTLPFTEGFETGNTDAQPVALWSSVYVTGTKNWTANSTATSYNRTPRTGSFNAFLGWSASTWMIRPVQLTGGTSYDVEVFARQDNADTALANMTIAYGTSGTAAGMTNIIVPQTGLTNGDYQRLIGSFTPPSTGVYYIGILGTLPTTTNWYVSIDDITIRETPATPIFSVTPAAWDFGQTVINTVNTKQFTVANSGGGSLTISNIGISGSYYTLTSNPAPVTLGASQSATFTVQYAPTVAGTHEGTVTITDARAVSTVDLEGTCYDPTQPLPYTQDFNGGTSLTAINWAGDMYIATPHGTDGSNGLYRNLYSSVPSCNAITPPIGPMITNAQLKFDYRFVNWSSYPANATPLGAGDNLQIQVSTDAGASYTTVYTIDQSNHVTSTSFANVSVSLAAYTTGSIMIRFLGTRANGDYYLDIDNVIVQEAPAGAPNPVTLNNPANEATGLPQNGFNLTWTPAQTGGTPTYYGVFMSQDEATIYEGVYFETTATLLNPTTYAGGPSSPITFNYEDRWYWTVQAINDDGDALVEPAYWFNIESDPTISAFPYQESFETHADNTLPSGWTRSSLATGWEFGSDLSSSYWDIPTHTVYAAANDDAAGSSGDGSMDILTMPPINLSGANPGAPVLTFDSYYDGSYSQLAYVEASTDGSTWTNIYDVPTGTDWVAQTVSLVDYNGMNPVYVRFHSDDNGSWASGWAIDNVALIYSTVDIYAPVVDHYPTIGWPLLNTPIDITANVTDNPVMTSGIASVTLYYTINAGAETSIPMTLSGANYTAAIPGQPAGTTVAYYIVAVDAAPTPNTTTTATWDFVVDVPVTLQYDSGTSTTGLGLATGTLGVMTGFTNPYGAGNPIQINSVSAGMNNAGTANVHVFTYDSVNDVLVDVIPSFSQAFAAGVYLNIPLTNCVTTAGYFYVAFTDVVAPNYFSFDQTQPYYPGTHFIFFGSGYDLANLGTVEGSGFAGSWLIRAEVQAGVTTLETPAVSTSSVPTGVELSWNAITGANGYKVLASSDPYTADPWTELAFITGTTYTYTGVDNVKFFKVLATSDSPTRNAFVSSSRKSSSTRPALRAAQVRNVSIMPKPKQ